MTALGAILSRGQSGLLDHTIKWDALWYLNILHDHYVIDPLSPAFYPLFPLSVGTLSAATLHTLSYAHLGLLINTIGLGFAITALLKISREFGIERFRFLTVTLFLAAPAAIFLHLFYTEAIFVALGFWAYAFALQRRWLLVGITLALLTATRFPAVLFFGLCGLEYLRAYGWNLKRAANRNLLWFLLAPLGFVLYGLYLLAARGNFFAMFSAYTNAWTYLNFDPNIFHSIFCAGRETMRAVLGQRPFDNNITVNHSIPLLCLAILLASSIYLLFVRGKGIPLGVFGLCSIVFFTINSSFVAVHRYSLPCLGAYIALALICARHRNYRILVVGIGLAMVVAQTVLIHMVFVTNDFIG